MAETFTGMPDLDDYMQKISTADLLSGRHLTGHDNRLQNVALRLKENAWHLYITLSTKQQTDFNLFTQSFGKNYTTNPHILKTRLKTAEQQPKQDKDVFFSNVRTFTTRAHPDYPNMVDQMILTNFFEV